MEVSSSTLSNSIPCYYSAVGKSTIIGKSIARVTFRPENRGKLGFQKLCCGFEDKGYLDYYMVSPVCGEKKGKKRWNGMSTKKRMKLLKGLEKDLMVFEELGFGLGLDSYQDSLNGDERGKLFSQAAETLLAQLKQLKAEEERMKKMEKQEKKKSLMQDSDSSSSSESSESSDSECDAGIDMNHFKNEPVKTKEMNWVTKQSSIPTEPEHNMILDATLNENATIEALDLQVPNLEQSNTGGISSLVMTAPHEERIEVCMGGKCKKFGGLALMDEFKKVVGDGGVVVGCKCMGKCKSGPNVKVGCRNSNMNLCVGVGLEDVELIVANYFGVAKKRLDIEVADALHS